MFILFLSVGLPEIDTPFDFILLVLGVNVGEAARENEDKRKEAMVHFFYFTSIVQIRRAQSVNFTSRLHKLLQCRKQIKLNILLQSSTPVKDNLIL